MPTRSLPLIFVAVLGCKAGTITADEATSPSDGGQRDAWRRGDSGPPVGLERGVTVTLERNLAGPELVSFGVPVPRGLVKDLTTVRVRPRGGDSTLSARVRELLAEHDKNGARIGTRALLVQFPAQEMQGDGMVVDILWNETGGDVHPIATTSYRASDVSVDSPVIARTTERTIVSENGQFRLREGAIVERTVYMGREPGVLAIFPPGYLAGTGILGELATAEQAKAPQHAGLRSLSEAIATAVRSASFLEEYALHPASVEDMTANYEEWLYDPCATYLIAYAHVEDPAFLRHAFKACSWYAGKINLSGSDVGIFSGKPDPDPKYSHSRGLYAYYALTGDEVALAAATAIAEMWNQDSLFVGPYREGRLRGEERLWTERLLGASLEGLWYGFRFTGDSKYLGSFLQMIETASRHVTGTAADLAIINPWYSFPPQDCFIHSALQQAEGDAGLPWCSPWMTVLAVDPLLRYQELSQDPRVDEVFIRIARFLRDVGTSYLIGDLLGDSFLSPSQCFDPTANSRRRRLVPLYGAGRDASGVRRINGSWSDLEHCADVTALTAAALRALARTGRDDENPVAPFTSEGASILALHHELASCAAWMFDYHKRERRNPAVWTSRELAEGASDPAAFILDQKIGFPSYNIAPNRKLSWWFNTSMLQFRLLEEAGIEIPSLLPGQVQPASCPSN
ncbi:MAG: hypothetical protein HY698_01970 [Deltaproteobacteria bacterium]|nr:hypothetical protein [Deltaproteobacteria bacterium]